VTVFEVVFVVDVLELELEPELELELEPLDPLFSEAAPDVLEPEVELVLLTTGDCTELLALVASAPEVEVW